jgi:Ca2+-binding RTX toxin-like protein
MSRSPQPTPAQLIEPLEPRQLFTGIFFSHHQLSLIGAPNFPNTITVALNPGGQSLSAQILIHTLARVIDLQKNIPLSAAVRLVYLRGGQGDDYIQVDQTYGSFSIPVKVVAAAGNDTVMTGDEPDQIFGGSGDDSIFAGAGNDQLFGQDGNDTLDGGPGDDYLNGAKGYDQLTGDAGNDTLVDLRGPDKVYGGPGNNVFYLPSLKLDHLNDYDPAKDKFHYARYNAPASSTSTSFLNTVFPILNL